LNMREQIWRRHPRYANQLVTLVAVAIVIASQHAFASDIDNQTLKGLPGFYVAVEEVNEIGRNAGIQAETLARDVELRLESQGARVYRTGSVLARLAESSPTTGFVYLNVNIGAVGPVLCWALQFQVLQASRLVRDPSIMQPTAATWGYANILHCGTKAELRSKVLDITDELVTAWRSVNESKPKE